MSTTTSGRSAALLTALHDFAKAIVNRNSEADINSATHALHNAFVGEVDEPKDQGTPGVATPTR